MEERLNTTAEEGSFPEMTSQDNQRYTRLTCLTCNKSKTGTHSQEIDGTVTYNEQELSQELDGTGTHNEQDLSQQLETTPPPKKTSKLHAPPDHIISSITADLQQARLDDNLEDIKLLLGLADLHLKT